MAHINLICAISFACNCMQDCAAMGSLVRPNVSIPPVLIPPLGGDAKCHSGPGVGIPVEKGCIPPASMRYLNQRYSCPYNEVTAVLTDIGTEELAHLEIVSAIVHQLTRNLSMDEIKSSGFDQYFVDHTTGIYPVSAAGVPFTTAYLQSKGDLITDLHEDLAADGATSQGQQSENLDNKRVSRTCQF